MMNEKLQKNIEDEAIEKVSEYKEIIDNYTKLKQGETDLQIIENLNNKMLEEIKLHMNNPERNKKKRKEASIKAWLDLIVLFLCPPLGLYLRWRERKEINKLIEKADKILNEMDENLDNPNYSYENIEEENNFIEEYKR